MKRLAYTLLLSAGLFSLPAEAVSPGRRSDATSPLPARELIARNPLAAATNHMQYTVLDSTITSPPCGYKPFYVSHFSRHGSRGHSSPKEYRTLDSLVKWSGMGLLTEDGEWLKNQIAAVKAANERSGYGELTSRGASEHRHIARRMAANFPQVFSDPARTAVHCYSTSVGRVIASMDSFTDRLAQEYPALEFTKEISADSPRAKEETNCTSVPKSQKKQIDSAAFNAYRRTILPSIDWGPLLRKTFVDGKAPASFASEPGKLFYKIYTRGQIHQCFDDPSLECIENYFTTDELYTMWAYDNAFRLFSWGCCAENGGFKAKSASGILDCIIRDADAVISGDDPLTCATLRFSHDGYLQPLLSRMRLQYNDFDGPVSEANDHYNSSFSVHMGGNVQLVFFRRECTNSPVLVKILLSDQEVVIPGLKPDRKGVFYDWDRLKAWWQN